MQIFQLILGFRFIFITQFYGFRRLSRSFLEQGMRVIDWTLRELYVILLP